MKKIQTTFYYYLRERFRGAPALYLFDFQDRNFYRIDAEEAIKRVLVEPGTDVTPSMFRDRVIWKDKADVPEDEPIFMTIQEGFTLLYARPAPKDMVCTTVHHIGVFEKFK